MKGEQQMDLGAMINGHESLNKEEGEREKEKRSQQRKKLTKIKRRGDGERGNNIYITPNARQIAAMTRQNTLNLIVNSTACIFRLSKDWYKCLVCTETTPDIEQLREHSSEHSLKEYETKMKSYICLIKAEISQLACKLCRVVTPNLTELQEHLTSHSIPFHGKDHLLVPYKIARPLICQICDEEHDSFRVLNIHVNKHYTKQVCEICGSTFSNRTFLNLHKSRIHRVWRCAKCSIIFSKRAEKAAHDRLVHGCVIRPARFPCSKCDQRFSQEAQRARHLVEKHGAPRPEHKCEICAKAFITRGLKNGHVKSAHRKERIQACDLCPRLFFSRSDVTRHRVTHTGERRFGCDVCGAAFATKGSLNRHVRRSHVISKTA